MQHVSSHEIHGVLQKLSPQPAPRTGATATVKVEISEPMGAETFLYLDSGATSFIARVQPTAIHAHGATVHLAFTPEKLHLFDAEKEGALV